MVMIVMWGLRWGEWWVLIQRTICRREGGGRSSRIVSIVRINGIRGCYIGRCVTNRGWGHGGRMEGLRGIGVIRAGIVHVNLWRVALGVLQVLVDIVRRWIRLGGDIWLLAETGCQIWVGGHSWRSQSSRGCVFVNVTLWGGGRCWCCRTSQRTD